MIDVVGAAGRATVVAAPVMTGEGAAVAFIVGAPV
jgi:hypothetical protein